MTDFEQFFSIKDAAEMCGISQRTLLRYEAQGLIAKRIQLGPGRVAQTGSAIREYQRRVMDAAVLTICSGPESRDAFLASRVGSVPDFRE